MYQKIVFYGYAIILFVMSLIAFILFLRDKKLSQKSLIRIKEKTLLGFTAMGGALGALLGSILGHHKTNKIYFAITIIFSLILQAAVFAFLLWVMVKA